MPNIVVAHNPNGRIGSEFKNDVHPWS